MRCDAAKIDYRKLHVEAHGEDAEDRISLVHFAMQSMADQGITLKPQQVTILGDTPRDIACARGAGCRCLAVATGRYSTDQLAEHAPDALFDELADIDAVLTALGIQKQA